MKFKTNHQTYCRNGIVFDEQSLTKQAGKEACDINNIINKYAKTGIITHLSKKAGSYADYSKASSYHESMNLVLEAQEQFNELPAELRFRFQNDPYHFLEFVNNPENIPEMQKMGLLEKNSQGSENDQNSEPTHQRGDNTTPPQSDGA
jgi:phage internal scaffolding protein